MTTTGSEPSRPAGSEIIEQVIEPTGSERIKGFQMRDVMANAPSVGPFVLFHHIGPVKLGVGQGADAGPHPHVGMINLTYLFEGSLLHRDSMGNAAALTPGGVNWLLCGSGVAHSERTPSEMRQRESRLHAAQFWLALPPAHEEDAPRFEHHPASTLPVLEEGGRRLRVIIGSFDGVRSPASTFSGTLCVHAELAAGARLTISGTEHAERSLYVVSGEVTLGAASLVPERLILLKPGVQAVVTARTPSVLLLLGGERIDHKHVWSTVVASSTERIERARADWTEGRIASVTGETERGAFP